MDIFLYEEIGANGITAKAFADQLTKAKGKPVTLRINSPGGSVDDGLAIANLIREHGQVNAQIDGGCASIATVITCACASVSMAENAMLFVHQPLISGQVEANAGQLRKIADGLDVSSGVIMSTYLRKTDGKATEEQLKALMDGDTYLDSTKALALGFVDKVNGKAPLEVLNKFKGLIKLNTGNMENEIINADTPAPVEAPAPAFDFEKAFADMSAKIDSLTELVKGFASKPEDKPAEEAPVAEAAKKIVQKAFKPAVTEVKDKTFAEMSVMERARYARERNLKK